MPFDRIDKKVLERGHLRFFTADTDLGASFAFGCLLTLKTKHGVTSLIVGDGMVCIV